jgi:hypothetical protein
VTTGVRTKADFYLASSEGYGLEQPRTCYRIKQLKSHTREDLLLIRIDPPIPGQAYGFGGRDIDKVVVATRHVGSSLFPIRDWPVFVHVAIPLIDNLELRERVEDQEIREIGWAELYQTRKAAKKK